MLTSDLAMSWQRGKLINPRYLKAEDRGYLQTAADLITIVSEHRGLRRASLDEALEEYVGVGTDYRILRGLIKLITDRCSFETAGATDPAEIRRALFFKARLHHPVTASADARQTVTAEAAEELGCAPAAVIEHLYGDLPENQRLMDFDEMTAAELIDAYNLAQAQALLYRSVEMQIEVEPQEPASLRKLFDAIKAYRLIHTIQGSPQTGYEIILSGPVSIFHRSQKYGVQMAVFLPALLACEGWRMRAEIAVKSAGSAFFELTSRDSRLRPDALSEALNTNPLIDKLLSAWKDASGQWRAEYAREVIDLGGGAFVPDLVVHGADGRKVYVEALGFWTPRYLAERLAAFERAGFTDFILTVSEELRGSRDAPQNLPPNVVVYKTSLSAEAIRQAAIALQRE
jgi:uncharacterized protein